ncbi:hypothetical protein FN846DRAFT_771816 [Sphaerosporella brunnea]|uniref:Cora-like Mg2+ transporter protein-domain-containing protein n=1 Tax=Sphaerosporella brunnea TaxID=1250544 RepID=A0A5J5F9B4_9PEZI|nr:hypothetical protein FN846DRAFT_771816 [Sphaerosporella brunnea]
MDRVRSANDNVTLSRTDTGTTTRRSSAELLKPRLSLPRKAGRARSPGLQWHREYTEESCRRPRVLMIDYVRKESGGGGGAHTRKVLAEEIHDLAALEQVYVRGARNAGAGGGDDGGDGGDELLDLRLFHVQNWPEAAHFLSHKFRLREQDPLTGQAGFADWIAQKKPRRRAGKPLLMAKTWKLSSDPWRRVTKCAVGLDVMKRYRCLHLENPQAERQKPTRVTGLMGYDADEIPVLHSNVFAQRTSMYVQYSQPDLQTPGPELVAPYRSHDVSRYDNGNCIVIFDNSDSHSIYDTIIAARGEWESRWRRLPFYLRNVKQEHGDEGESMTAECMRTITQDFFKAVAENWDDLLDASWDHISILEDQIYEHPADESRAPSLWKNQAKWLVYEKIMYGHQDAVNDLRKYLVELDGDLSDEGQWLRESPADFTRLGNQIEEDLVKRTNNLSDLMYKSVGIRDSHESLRLGASMWRLSWITFIFLPLTFLVSFFGMNVDTFKGNPSIKWYFISAVPFMLFVLLLWYILKHLFAKSRQQPLQRGAYEALFTELQSRRPDLFTRQGPRDYIRPADRKSRWKWRLIQHWTAGDAVPRAAGSAAAEEEPVGQWNRLKRYLIQRWTAEINISAPPADIEATGPLISAALHQSVLPAVVAAVEPATPSLRSVMSVVPESRAAEQAQEHLELPEWNSGLLVEERTEGADGSWAQGDGDAVDAGGTGPENKNMS